MSSVTSLTKAGFSLSHNLLITNSFLAKGGDLCSLPLFHCGHFLWLELVHVLNLCMLCVCSHGLCEFMCTFSLLALENTIFLKLSTSSGSSDILTSYST